MGKCRMPLDFYDLKPDAMIAYLRYNGYHFNKKMCDWAVSHMRKVNKASGKDRAYKQGQSRGNDADLWTDP